MTDQQQVDLRKDEIEAGTTTGLASPSVDPLSARQNSLWSDAWAALKRNPLFWFGSVLTLMFTVMAIVPQVFARGQDPRACDLANSRALPSAEHWFGYDVQGCDYLANVVYGARNSLIIGVFAVVVLLRLGGGVGAVSGCCGGVTGSILSRIADIFCAVSLILGALVLLRVRADTRIPIISSRGPGAVAISLALFG